MAPLHRTPRLLDAAAAPVSGRRPPRITPTDPVHVDRGRCGAAAEHRHARALLSTTAAEQAAGRVGADLGRVRQALPALTDAEARDLAARAAALDRDPAAGLLGTLTDLLVLVLLVVLILLVVQKLN